MRKIGNSRFNNTIFAFLSVERANFAIAVLCALVVALMDLLRPWTLKVIIDNILLDKPLPAIFGSVQYLIETQKTAALVLVASSILLVSGIKAVSTYTQVYLSSRIGFRLAHRLRSDLFSHLQRLSLAFHKNAETGELLTKVTNDTNNLRDTFSSFILTFLTKFVTLAGMLIVMFLMNWQLSLMVVATFPVLTVLSVHRFFRIRESARRQRRAEGKIASRVHKVLNSIAVVQAFGREDLETEQFRSQSRTTLDESVKTAKLEAVSSRSVDLVATLGTFAVLVFGSMQALEGKITPGSVLVFVAYMNSLNVPIRTIAKVSAKISRAWVSAGRIREILEVTPEVEDRPDSISVRRLRGEIEFRNVSFGYNDGERVLRNLSFTISPGEKTALIGASGAGKSTIICLLLRFYDVWDGRILIDGRDIRDYKCESLRNEIGIVLQDTILPGDTVLENILYGNRNATPEDVKQAARSADAEGFITGLSDGYDTVIGSDGQKLSGGQRQKLAIARAFVRDVPILILDEPMTGLDVFSERSVRGAMERLMRNRTSLLITHDIESASDADTILILQNGRITSKGSHTELITASRTYRSLIGGRTAEGFPPANAV